MVSGTWLLMERTYRVSPAALTSVMIAAFGFKVVFFGGYVAVMLRSVGAAAGARSSASFTGYFIGLYLVEALYMRRLFSVECVA